MYFILAPKLIFCLDTMSILSCFILRRAGAVRYLQRNWVNYRCHFVVRPKLSTKELFIKKKFNTTLSGVIEDFCQLFKLCELLFRQAASLLPPCVELCVHHHSSVKLKTQNVKRATFLLNSFFCPAKLHVVRQSYHRFLQYVLWDYPGLILHFIKRTSCSSHGTKFNGDDFSNCLLFFYALANNLWGALQQNQYLARFTLVKKFWKGFHLPWNWTAFCHIKKLS